MYFKGVAGLTKRFFNASIAGDNKNLGIVSFDLWAGIFLRFLGYFGSGWNTPRK